MNIFVTNTNSFLAAQDLDDKRVVKMVLETAQLLSTALRFHGVESTTLYKTTHVNHPCAIWVRQNKCNYKWTLDYFFALCTEYTIRFGKIHKSFDLYPEFVYKMDVLPNSVNLTPFVNCARNKSLGVDYTDISDVTMAYRLYLSDRWESDKRKPTWTRSN
tara:strand:- start:88 stop:567 length:480 start_codon:yes stop_codon:yes gene_type:complete